MMKSRFGLSVLGLFVFLSITGPNYLSAAEADTAKSAAPADVKLMQANGKVVSLDPQSGQLILKSKKTESNFVLTPGTVYKKGRNTFKPASLKPGMAVRVRYYEQNGQRVADRVTITSGKVHHAKEGGNE